jgi:hypothetical protein
VFDDAVGDNLTGNAGTDWFFAKRTTPGLDNVTPATGETVTTPGAPPAPLLAQGGARVEDGSLAALTQAQLAPIVEEAQARWIGAGLSREQQTLLASLTWQIADLDAATLGLTVGNTITIDLTAAGYGWFVDVTPVDEAEFHFVRGLAQWIADGHSPAFGQMDLLTTVMHEIGHVLGYDDQSALRLGSGQAQRHSANLMTETLPTGVRRALLTDLVSSGASDPSTASNSPVRSFLSSPGGRSLLDSFTGLWGGSLGQGHAAPTMPRISVTPVIDWTDRDEADSRQKKSVLGASPQKASWLQRFLLQMGQDDVKPHDHGIEVVLPGKKK